jgi:hypothetical protein
MKRLVTSIGCAMLACLARMPAQAEMLYDGFTEPHIDPAKWIGRAMCQDAKAYDCVREALLGHLRLAVRGNGNPDLTSGEAIAESGLRSRAPETIDGIRFRFVVKSFSSQGCSSPGGLAAHPQLLAFGSSPTCTPAGTT